MAQYPNLPGIEVQIADGGLILPEDTTTQSLLIIAPSVKQDAPKEPVLVRQSSDLMTNGFGSFVEGGVVNPIAAAWKAAFEGGNRRTYLMSLGNYNVATGEVEDVDAMAMTAEDKFVFLQETLFGILADFPVDHLALVGVFADKEASLPTLPKLSEGVIHEYFVEGTAVTFPLTVAGGTDDVIEVDGAALTLTAKTYADAEDLQEEIEKEVAAAGLEMRVSLDGDKVRLAKDTEFELTIGTTAAGLAPGTATEKTAGNFALLAGQYAENQTLNHNSTIAYVGASAPAGNTLSQVKAHVDKLVAMQNEYSGYVSVIAAPELGYILPGRSDLYFTNGLVTYASLVSTLRAESAPTNKRVYGVAGIHYNLSLRQLNALTGNKFVTFRLKNGQVIVTDGCTTAPDYYMGGQKQSSDFARLSTLRITQAASQLVRDLTESFIGEPNRMPQYNSMNATIKGGLEAMKSQGAIYDYRFTVVARGGTLSEAVVTLELIPAFEMRKVSVNVSLKPAYTM
jgi:hypothetical protein